MKKNIAVVCLVNDYKKRVAKALADELEMFYADVNEIMEYNFINDEMLEKAGQQYFDENESKTVKTIASYDNTIIVLNFSTMNKGNNLDILKKDCLIVYLKLDFEKFCELNRYENQTSLIKINETAFADRDAYLSSFADVIVQTNSSELPATLKDIMDSLDRYFC